MTQIELLTKLINDFNNTKDSKVIKYNVAVPEYISDLYTKVSEEISKLYYKIKDIFNLLHPTSTDLFTNFESNFGDLETSVVIAGGSISDLIISKELNREYNPKDIDVFIQKSLPDFLSELFDTKTDNPYFDYDFALELYHNGWDVREHLKDRATLGYALMAEVLKNVLDDSLVEMSAIHSYSFSNVNLLIRGSFTRKNVEIILSDDDKIFNFDVLFRSCFYTRHTVYCLDTALEDIRNKIIHIADGKSAVTTLLRALYFEKKFGFTIDSLSFNALLEIISGNISVDSFLGKILKHPKCTDYVRNRIFELFHIPTLCTLPAKESELVLHLKIPTTNSNDLFSLLEERLNNSPIHFPKIKSLLMNLQHFDGLVYSYKRPDDWCDLIFENKLSGVNFFDWYKAAFLYDNIQPISEHRDLLYSFVTSNENPKDAYKVLSESEGVYNLLESLSIIVKNDILHFPILPKNIVELLLTGISSSYELDIRNNAGKLHFNNKDWAVHTCPVYILDILNASVQHLPDFPAFSSVLPYKKYL